MQIGSSGGHVHSANDSARAPQVQDIASVTCARALPPHEESQQFVRMGRRLTMNQLNDYLRVTSIGYEPRTNKRRHDQGADDGRGGAASEGEGRGAAQL